MVVPFARVTEIDLGGQVEKYPADDPDPATDAVIAVVPGCSAVIWLVSVLIEATIALLPCKLSVPMAAVQLGIELAAI